MSLNPARHVMVCLGDPNADRQLIVLCGLHGNEPSGREAILSCAKRIIEGEIPLQGQVLFIEGNLEAISQGQRYITRDLNRDWTEEKLRELREKDHEELSSEDKEQLELAILFEELLGSGKELFFLDLHTTSAESAPFIPFYFDGRGDSMDRVIQRLGLPRFMSETPAINGTLALYLAEKQIPSLAVEGGQHHAYISVAYHQSVLFLTLASLRMLPKNFDLQEHEARLELACAGLPKAVRPIFRHAITPSDEFRMIPGYKNFQVIEKGEILAEDKQGAVKAPYSGILLFPLYQPKGDEGFLIAEVLD